MPDVAQFLNLLANHVNLGIVQDHPIKTVEDFQVWLRQCAILAEHSETMGTFFRNLQR